MANLISFAAWPRLARAFAVMAIVSLPAGIASSALAADRTGSIDKAQADLLRAEKQFERTSREFGSQEQNPGQAPARNPAQSNSSQLNGQLSWSEASSGGQPAQPAPRVPDPSAEALRGSPETGYAGTWTDPATGDIITSVIAPKPSANQNAQSYPIIIEPQVDGGDWGAYDYGYGGGYGGWPQWPTSPAGPGYGPGFGPSPYPGPHGQGFNPPPPPGMIHPPLGQFPGPSHPGYRPLRPNPPPFGPGQTPGMTPPPGSWQHGMMPPPPPPGGGWNPGMNPPPPPNNPGSLWRPGMNDPMGPPPGHWGHRPGGWGHRPPPGPGFGHGHRPPPWGGF